MALRKDDKMANEILKLADYPDRCSVCGGNVEKRAMIMFNTFHKTVRHVKCKKEEEVKQNDLCV